MRIQEFDATGDIIRKEVIQLTVQYIVDKSIKIYGHSIIVPSYSVH